MLTSLFRSVTCYLRGVDWAILKHFLVQIPKLSPQLQDWASLTIGIILGLGIAVAGLIAYIKLDVILQRSTATFDVRFYQSVRGVY